MRCFVAIEIPEDIKSQVSRVVTEMALTSAECRWVKPENLHLTVKFLGEIEEDVLEDIGRALDECARGMGPFTLDIAGIGAFPSPSRPRVIWCGLSRGSEPLRDLFKVVDSAMERLGFEREKGFSPHLTIGRLKAPAGPGLKEAIHAREGLSLGSMEVTRLLLMKSLLTKEGPIYSRLMKVSLRP